jgi:hypothetical protein
MIKHYDMGCYKILRDTKKTLRNASNFHRMLQNALKFYKKLENTIKC